jgi:hypothetical protein
MSFAQTAAQVTLNDSCTFCKQRQIPQRLKQQKHIIGASLTRNTEN